MLVPNRSDPAGGGGGGAAEKKVEPLTEPATGPAAAE